MRIQAVVAILVGILLSSSPAEANVCGPVPQTLILLDRSGSMTGLIAGQSKWSIATGAVNSLTTTFNGQLDFGLMLFPRWPHVQACSSGKVNVGVAAGAGPSISAALGSTFPQGNTPLSLSLDEARLYLQQIKTTRPQVVILITDGMETCQPASVNSPQLAAGKLKGDGVDTYVVGFGGGVDPTSLSATAQAGGTGSYYQADNLTQLNAALQKIAALLSCCGDGKLDPGEVCDTAIPQGSPGACPTSCDDGDPCTDDIPAGSACQASCSFTAITAPMSNDGCCPPQANSLVDNDCPPSCGNGFVEPGEICDTAIPSGQAGSCPATCNDGNPCTTDTMQNSGCNAFCTHANTCSTQSCGDGKLDPGEWCDVAIPAGQPGSCPKICDDGDPCTKDTLTGTDCLAKCDFAPVTAPVNGDGCCVPGANSQTDDDCPKACGNGVLEPGEACDPGIPSGTGSCLLDCNDGDPCTVDTLEGTGCDVKCAHKPAPADAAQKDGCCPAGLTEEQDADCLPPCGPDRHDNCVNPCQGIQCKDGEYCKDGACVPWPKPTAAKDPTETETEQQTSGSAPEDGQPGYQALGEGSGCACRTSNQQSMPAGMSLLLILLLVGLRRRSG